MAENTGAGEAARGELVKGVESTFILARQSDAVYDGRTLKLGFLYDAHADPKLERPIADKQTGLTKILEQFGYLPDESDLINLSERLRHSLDVFGCTGVYLNCLGKPAQGGKASALATIAFLDYISENSTLSQSDLIKGAFEQTNKILSLYQAQAPGMDTSVDFSAALVDRDGKMVVLNTKGSEVVVLDKTGKIHSIGNTVSQAGVTTLETQLNPGDKIVLCADGDDQQLENQGSKSLREIVESTAKPQLPRRDTISVVAAEIKGEDRVPHVQRNDEGHDLGEIQKAVGHKIPFWADKPDSESMPPIKANEFAKTSYFKKYVGRLDQDGNLVPGETPGFILQLLDSADVKALVPQQADESPQLYRIRLLKEIIEKMTYQGDYPVDENPLAAKIFSQIADDDKFALMSAEALLSIYAQNFRTQEYAEKLGHLKADWRLEPAAAVKSMVFTHGTVYQPEGEYESIHDAEGKLTPQARKDITAARIIAERFMDQKDPTLDITLADYDSGLQGKTYRDVLDALAKRINDQALTKEERREAKKAHALVRSRFYSNLQKGIEASHAHNQYALTQQPELKTVSDIVNKINEEIRVGGIAKLKENYHGIFPIKDEDFILLEGQPNSFFRFAMKGAEYFQRMALLPLALEGVEGISDVIYDKNWIQGKETARMYLDLIAGKRTSVQRPVQPERVRTAPVRQEEQRRQNDQNQRRGDEEERREDQAHVDITPGHPGEAPVVQQQRQEDRHDDERHEPVVLPKDYSISLFGDVNQTNKEAENFEEQMRLGQVGQNTVTNRASGFWQRGIFSSVFQEREKRFRRNILAKTGLAHLPPELIKDAIETGRERAGARNNFRRFLDIFHNLGANVFGLSQTTSKIEAEKWLVEEVTKAKNNDPSADKKIRAILIRSAQDKEALAARLSRDVDDAAARQGNIIHQNEARKVIEDQVLQDDLVKDFFLLFKDYINFDSQVPEQVKKAEEQARILMEGYCSENGVDVKDDNNVVQHLSLRNRLKSEKDLADFQSKFTVVGTSMKRVADVLRAHRQGFVEPAGYGIVTDPTKVQSWVDATKSTDPNKKLNFKFFEARGELSTAGNREGMLESAARLLHLRNERQPAITGTGQLAKGVNWVSKLAMNLGINEVTAATIGGYAGSLLYSMIPTNTGKASMLGGVATLAGMPIPLMLATTTAGFPIAIPVLAGGAIAAGAVAAVREFRRLKGERMDLERQASFSIAPSDVKVNVGPLHSILRAVYGYTDRKDIEKTIAHQRASIDIIKGLTEESGLFTDPKDLTSAPPDPVDVAHVQKALRWMAEARARVDSSIGKNRRFIKYSSQLQEAQEQEIIDGASFEVYERLSHIFAENADLRTHFDITGTTDFDDFYKKLVDAFKYNLLGDDKKITGDTRTVVEAVVGNLNGNTQLLKNQGKEAEGLKARDRAFRGLKTGAAIHRFFGVGLSSLAIGDVMAEVRSGFQHTPESYVTGGAWQGIRHIFGEKPPVFTHSDQEYIVNGTHFKPPSGYNYDDSTHLLSTPDGRSVDVGKLDLSADPVKGEFTNPDTQAAFSQIGVKYEGFDKDTLYHATGTPHNERIAPNVELRLPGSVQLEHGPGDTVTSVTIDGKKIDFSHPLNLNNPTDYDEFNKVLTGNQLIVPEFKPPVSQSTDLVNHPFIIKNTEVNLKLPKDTDLIIDNSPQHLITGLKINGQTVNFDTPINPNSIDPTNEDSIRALTQALKGKGFQVGNIKSEQIDAGVVVSQVLQEKTITGEQVWNNLGHKIDHREWLQGNELKFHTLKANDTTVILDMTRMNVKNGDGVFFFSRPGHAGEPIGVYAENNQLRLNTEADPSHVYKTIDGHTISERELARLVVNKNVLKGLPNDDIATELNNRQDVFNIGADGKNGFIEAGKWENNTLKAMATIRGNSNVPTSITETVTPAPSVSAPHFKYSLEITRSGPQAPNIINIESASRNILNLRRDQEFAMGVVPLPFVEYSGVGKYPEIRSGIGVRPRPPFQPPPQTGTGQPIQQTDQPVVLANNTAQANANAQPVQAGLANATGTAATAPATNQTATITDGIADAIIELPQPLKKFTEEDKQKYFSHKKDILNEVERELADIEATQDQKEKSDKENAFSSKWRRYVSDYKKDKEAFVEFVYIGRLYDELLDEKAILKEFEDKEKSKLKDDDRRLMEKVESALQGRDRDLADIYEKIKAKMQEEQRTRLSPTERINISQEIYNREFTDKGIALTYEEYKENEKIIFDIRQNARLRTEVLCNLRIREILRQIRVWEEEVNPVQYQDSKTKELNLQLREQFDNFDRLYLNGVVDNPPMIYNTGENGRLAWQEVRFGPSLKNGSNNLYRGYLMIEPVDFQKALMFLSKVGEERKLKGKKLDFKWLLSASPAGITDQIDFDKKIGDYQGLNLTDPRIAIYGDVAEEIQEILQSLTELGWDEFEQNRIIACGGQHDNVPRRPGTSEFMDNKGKMYRSLNYKKDAGVSENEAADPAWRDRNTGNRTIIL